MMMAVTDADDGKDMTIDTTLSLLMLIKCMLMPIKLVTWIDDDDASALHH